MHFCKHAGGPCSSRQHNIKRTSHAKRIRLGQFALEVWNEMLRLGGLQSGCVHIFAWAVGIVWVGLWDGHGHLGGAGFGLQCGQRLH